MIVVHFVPAELEKGLVCLKEDVRPGKISGIEFTEGAIGSNSGENIGVGSEHDIEYFLIVSNQLADNGTLVKVR